MFTSSSRHEQGFDKIVLTDGGGGARAEIVPACGAMLHAFWVQGPNGALNVIEGYDDAEDFRLHVTDKGFRSSKLSPFVCRLANGTYRFGEKTYTTGGFYLGQNALHGLLYNAVFEVTASSADEAGASVTLLHQYTGSDAGFPFAYDCEVTWTLTAGNRLSVRTAVVNRSGGLMPVQDGWHPYFTFGGSIDALQLEFQSKEMVEFDGQLLPTGQLQPYQEFGSLRQLGSTAFDNCFVLNFAECQPLCVLRDADKKMQLEIYPDTSYPYLQIYTPPHRQSIAIENLSGAPDAFNNAMGLRVLEAEVRAEFTTAYKISRL